MASSSVIVYQGLQSCLEPDQVTESFVFQQKNLPKSSSEHPPQEFNNGGRKWSFLQALENPSMAVKNLQDSNEVYVHPMVKRSASALSTKSLEMCTESLGSETGSDVSESGDEFCSLSMEERERVRAVRVSKCYRSFDRKVHRGEFPPPLTSISGSDGTVKVRHHREGGRLVIKAVSVSSCGTNFKAERINGRLKLSLLKDCSVNNESERVEYENYETERINNENYEEGGEVESLEDEYVPSDDDDDVAVTAVAEEEEEEEGEEDGGGGGWRWKVGRPTGKGELKRLTRCKEGGNGNRVFANWRSSWVAIS
ncbi:protein FANTASTIC FOUR 1-like [Cynara cardunculus var. scolymus]|uniref:FAF domain-containing protein n=1 Tax=Cynara cardunculus var. scolymus TaxID=59895 RepID=A0A103Y7I9_CYNCS|nr:protein FANTASTIC FOUR 1-like [Cynara cardunculus var. scolymus]KVI03940.1 Protein of unknown function DUF3049 [Cynara cardunculus var. scolymus]